MTSPGLGSAASRRNTQYFEMIGNRAIYSDGWFAAVIHKAPWEPQPRATLENDKWELYDVRADFSLSHDLAAQNPAKLKELQALFMSEAKKYRVLPIDDRSIERLNAKLAGRPDLMGDRTSLTLYEGMTGIAENAFLNIKNRSHSISAEVEIPKGGANGVILAQGGRFGRRGLKQRGRDYGGQDHGTSDRVALRILPATRLESKYASAISRAARQCRS